MNCNKNDIKKNVDVEKSDNILHEAKQQSRKLDLLLAEADRQRERIEKLEDSKLAIKRRKPQAKNI